MFDEVEPPSGADDPSNLGQGGIGVRDRAQGEGAQGAVAAAVRKLDRLTVEPHLFDGDRRSGVRLPAIRRATLDGSTARTRLMPEG